MLHLITPGISGLFLLTEKMRLSFIITGMMILQYSFADGQERITVSEYIETYKEIAIEEMKKHQIPASITLAQGILESESGNSPLARIANNHFGIKCHKEWTGKTYIQDDDEKDECFRSYKSPVESYHDHSHFLTSRDRYNLLFDLEVTDYKGWAYGLKQAGYATNPRYPELLIKIIEENGLAGFDSVIGRQSPVAGHKPESVNIADENPEPETRNPELPAYSFVGRGGNDRAIFMNNGKKFILAREGDDFFGIASEFGIYSWQVYTYNELVKDDTLTNGQMVYLEKKRGRGAIGKYIVEEGDDLQGISQKLGIRMKALCRLNGIRQDEQVEIGEVLILK